MTLHYLRASLVAILIFTSFLARAEEGISKSEIKIGVVNDVSGPSDSAANKSYNAATRVFLDKINKAGGVQGHELKLFFYDDGYEPEKTAAMVKKAIEEDHVFLLMNCVGTPTTKAALPAVEKAAIPFLFPRTGDPSLRPLHHGIFNLRASYEDEVLALIKEVVVGRHLHRLAIFVQDDGFGSVIKTGVTRAFSELGLMDEVRKRGSAFVAEGVVHRNSKNIDDAYQAIAKGNPEAILLATPSGQAVRFVQKAAADHRKWQILAVSNNSSLPSLLSHAESQGMLISQVMPIVSTSALPIVKQFRADMESSGEKDHIDEMAFEGYLNTVLTVEALKRTGPPLSRGGLIHALETSTFDLGGIGVSFSPESHNAKLPVSIATVKNGRLE